MGQGKDPEAGPSWGESFPATQVICSGGGPMVVEMSVIDRDAA